MKNYRSMKHIFEIIKNLFIKYVYAEHNNRLIVRRKLNVLLSELDNPDKNGLNVGAGSTKIHPRILNMDIFSGNNIDIVGDAEDMPCKDNNFDVVICQECLEHVRDPFKAMQEISRIMKKGGLLYLQVPFIIGYHPGPTDFWRFTVEGIRELVSRNNMVIKDSGIVVGGGSGYYRVSVEFFAGLLSLPIGFLYRPFKAVFALVLFPIKFFDYILMFSAQKDRIAGGYYIIAVK